MTVRPALTAQFVGTTVVYVVIAGTEGTGVSLQPQWVVSTVVVLVSQPVGQGTRNVVVRVMVTFDLAESELVLRHESQTWSEETVVRAVLFSHADHVCAGSLEATDVVASFPQADQVCAASVRVVGVVAELFSQADQVCAGSLKEGIFLLDDQFSQSLVTGLVAVVDDFLSAGQLDQCDSMPVGTLVEPVWLAELEEWDVRRVVVETMPVGIPGRFDLAEVK